MKKKSLCYFTIDLSNPFGETLLKSVYDGSRIYDFNLFVVHGGMINSPNEWEKKRNILYNWVAKHDFDALLITNIFSFVNAEQKQEFIDTFSHIPLVTLHEKFDKIPSILVDNSAGYRDLLHYLINECKSKNFAVITGPENNIDSIQRFQVLQSVMAANEIEITENHIYHGTFGTASAIEAVRTLLDVRKVSFDTLICFNDCMAISAMEELKRRGFNIPGDIKITGFDNTYASQFMAPPLTTVELPVYDVGKKGIETVVNIFKKKPVEPVTTLHTRFIPRLSTGFVPGQRWFSIPRGLPDALVSGESIATPDQVRKLVDVIFIENFIEVLIKNNYFFLSDRHRGILVSTTDGFIDSLVSALKVQKGYMLIEFLENNIYSDHCNEWSYEIWPHIIAGIAVILGQQCCTELGTEVENYLLSAVLTARMKQYGYIVKNALLERTEEEYLLQIGEDLVTSFDLSAISNTIAQYCRFIGVHTCFVVIYTNVEKTEADLIVRIEQSRQLPTDSFTPFHPECLLPQTLLKTYPSLIMEALYVKDEDLGYMLFNLDDHPGILYKSLRQQIATAIKSTHMLNMINNYSGKLETMVEERTERLHVLNTSLQTEMEKRKLVEKKLLKQRNLESLGVLAGGIAHDFNNILMKIAGTVTLLQNGIDNETHIDNNYKEIIDAVEKAKFLTSQLLTFAYGNNPVKMNLPLVPLLKEVISFNIKDTDIRVEYNLKDILKDVNIDPTLIRHVLNNIITNAVQAMENQGVLTVSGSVVSFSDDQPHLQKGDYIRISIADTGIGIPENAIDKIFDPYFSIKEDGVGLGLSTSLAIMQRHGGYIDVESWPGKGSVFYLLLPV